MQKSRSKRVVKCATKLHLRLSSERSEQGKLFRIAHTDDKTVNSLQESTNQPTNQPINLIYLDKTVDSLQESTNQPTN